MAWILPVALAAFGAISQNAQNKAAIKNNETQQAGAVGNAQKARDDFNAWSKANPSPLAGLHMGAPPSFGGGQGFQPSNVNAASIFGAPPAPSAPAGGSAPGGLDISAILQMLMGAHAGVNAATTQPAARQPEPGNPQLPTRPPRALPGALVPRPLNGRPPMGPPLSAADILNALGSGGGTGGYGVVHAPYAGNNVNVGRQ